jgi:raffinose synthase
MRIERDVLLFDGAPLLEGLSTELSLELVKGSIDGAFLRAQFAEAKQRLFVKLGRVPGARRFVACHRYEPFWMKPHPGSDLSLVPGETQCLWVELDSGEVALVVPLLEAPLRAALEGKEDGLWAVLDSGDPYSRASGSLVAYVAVGDDPFELAERSAEAIRWRLQQGRLRREKPLPRFVDHFGWCTWDAFYQEVSHEKVEAGLASFREGGIEPRFLILDDGWQSVQTAPTGERRLYSFEANEKFSRDLGRTVRLAKKTFSIETFLVWHAVHGYWGGVDGEALPDYGVETCQRSYSPEILAQRPSLNFDWWGPLLGRPALEALERFYADYHAELAKHGVDGVKVDNQASVECAATGVGGRVVSMLAHRRALEASARKHFDGALINCMSSSNEMLFQALDSTLTRTSTDFWPNRPSSHGLHVYTNALVGLFFGEFVHPDWDMFQSGHPAGAFHAAARAVSGSPVYVSDPPGRHDFELLSELVLSDGSVLRASGGGGPPRARRLGETRTRDSLFGDPLCDPVLFKVWNQNATTSVVGVFNLRSVDGNNVVSGSVGPSDVPGLDGDDFALFLFRENRLARLDRTATVSLSLDTLGSEIATIVRLERGVGALGLSDKLNGGGAVTEQGFHGTTYVVELRDGGRFVAFSAERPRAVLAGGAPTPFGYSDGRLDVEVPKGRPVRVELRFE